MIPKDLGGKGKVVLVGGVFDIVHPGHISFLQKAREFGDFLCVVVARDSTALALKRAPVVPEDQRVKVVGALSSVDFAVLGYERKDFIEIVKDIGPDVIVVGPNQMHDVKDLRGKLKKAGLTTAVKRVDEVELGALYSSKRIVEKIRESL